MSHDEPVFGEDGMQVLAPQVQIPVQVPQVLTTQVPRDSAKSSNDDDDVEVVNVTSPSKKQKVMGLVQTALNKLRDLEREFEEAKNIVKENLKEGTLFNTVCNISMILSYFVLYFIFQ